MKNELGYIVFDLDGTLVNTLADIASVYNQVFESRGLKTHSCEDYKSFIGWGLAKVFDFALEDELDQAEKASMLDEVLRHYAENPIRYSSVYPGIMDLLSNALAAGWRLGVYSNKKEEITVKIVQTVFPRSMFDFVIGGTAAFPLKPDPAALLRYVREHNLVNSPMIMVGDSPVDVETARNADIPFAGVCWGFRSEGELFDAGSEDNFHHAADLWRWIKESRR